MSELAGNTLDNAREQAREVRRLYEILENRINGKVWSLHELMLGFANDAGYVGRLILAKEGTWGIDSDPDAELEHKLSEVIWWAFVIADRLGIDMAQAYDQTMERIESGLQEEVDRRDHS